MNQHVLVTGTGRKAWVRLPAQEGKCLFVTKPRLITELSQPPIQYIQYVWVGLYPAAEM